MKYLTLKEMSEVDKLAVEDFRISEAQLMENAGRNVADFVAGLKPERVFVVYGKGNNGGDGLCAARHLIIRGFDVKIIPVSDDLNENAKNQLFTLSKMGIKPSNDFKAKKRDVIIDALLGYNIKGNPRELYAERINSINEMGEFGAKVVSFDLPSGLDSNIGKCFESCVKADYVLTLALPKKGLEKMKNVYLVNIGVPNEVYLKLGIKLETLFKKGDVVRVG